jgi:hypothetical protein
VVWEDTVSERNVYNETEVLIFVCASKQLKLITYQRYHEHLSSGHSPVTFDNVLHKRVGHTSESDTFAKPLLKS